MARSYVPRLTYVDTESRTRLFQSNADSIRSLLDMIQNDPGTLIQTRYASLVQAYQGAGEVLYALGYPLEAVRGALALAAFAGLRVAELRSTEDPFPAVVVTLNPNNPNCGVERPVHPPGKKDNSLGNSFENFVAVVTALTAGELGIARRLAALAGDPPDAHWVGPRSFCTPNDQHVAGAVRHLFAGATDEALDSLDRVRLTRQRKFNFTDFVDTTKAVTMLRALATADPDLFLEGLRDLIRWHEATAMKPQNWDDSGFYLCLPGTGLALLALHRGLIARDQLPSDTPFLPIDLIELSQRCMREDTYTKFRTIDMYECE